MLHENITEKKLPYIRQQDIFQGLSTAQFNLLAENITELTVNVNEIIFCENDVGDEFYIIMEGRAQIRKYDNELGRHHFIGEVGPGDVIGETLLIDGAPRPATVSALEQMKVYKISIKKLRALIEYESLLSRLVKAPLPIHNVIVQNIAKKLSKNERTSTDLSVAILRTKLIHEKTITELSRFVINILVLISTYVLILQNIMPDKLHVISTTMISIPVMITFGFPLLYMMKRSGYPMSMYGLTTKGWRKAVVESIVLTLPILAMILLYKIVLIHTSPEFANRHIFDLSLSLIHGAVINSYLFGALVIIGYIIFVPIQELVVRGALQSSFDKLMVGKNKSFWSIVLSNLIFSVFHAHISLGFGLIVYLPGLFWGWMYSRQRTLIGVTLSHLIVGAWAIFIVGLL